MGRASAAKSVPDRRKKILAQRAAAHRKQQTRKRLLAAGGSITAVIAIAVALVVVKASSSSEPAPPVGPTGKALSRLIAATTSIPAATLDKVGTGTNSTKPTVITGAPLTQNGKPEVVYVGAEYCPYCAVQRWPMIVALSRFGRFSGLETSHSAFRNGAGTAEPYPNTRTWTFAHSSYQSKYLSFASVELNNNIPDKATGSYGALQVQTPAERALMKKYDAPPYVASAENGAVPFVDYGNRYMSTGASFNPGVLSGLSWNQIATQLHYPSSPVGRAVGGSANYITAAVCNLTGNRPASACTPVVRGLERNI